MVYRSTYTTLHTIQGVSRTCSYYDWNTFACQTNERAKFAKTSAKARNLGTYFVKTSFLLRKRHKCAFHIHETLTYMARVQADCSHVHGIGICTPYSWVEVCRLVAFHKTISNHLEKTHSHVRVKLAIQLHGGEMRTNLGDKKFHIPSYIGWYLIRILCVVFQKKKCDLSFSLISYIWLEKTSFVQQRTYIAQTKNESSAYFLNDRQGNIW